MKLWKCVVGEILEEPGSVTKPPLQSFLMDFTLLKIYDSSARWH